MKVIALLTDLFGAVGGIQTFNRSLVQSLDELAVEKNWDVTALVLNDGTGAGRGRPDLVLPKTEYIPFNRRKGAFIAATFRQATATSVVIFGHVNFAPMALGLRIVRPSLKTILAIYGIDVWSRLPILEREGAKAVRQVLSISASTRDRAVATNGLDPSRISILPCTLDPLYGNGQSAKSRPELSLPRGPMVLTVSRLHVTERYKRIDVLIQAMKKVVSARPDAFLAVVGDGPSKARLQRLALDLGIQHNVIFSGRVPSELLPAYYQNSDLFVLPSIKEGFGIVFLEAMYYAKACIGVRAGGIPEVIADGKTGYLAKPDDPEDLAGSILRLISDDKLRDEMGQAGKDRLESEFSPCAFKRRLETALAIS